MPVPSLPQELQKLQAHLELLKQEFVAEEQLTLEQQVYKPNSPAVNDYDPKRSGLNSERWKGWRRDLFRWDSGVAAGLVPGSHERPRKV